MGIHRLAQTEAEKLGPATYQLYVMEVDDPGEQVPYRFYVGTTKESPEKRRIAHTKGGLYAAAIFRRAGVTPGPLRPDLTQGLPRFRCRACAKDAEGRLARVIAAQLGPAHSDQLTNRRRGATQPCEGLRT